MKVLALACLALLVCGAYAQTAASFTTEDARVLGSNQKNICVPVCVDAGKRNKALASPNVQTLCQRTCQQCVVAVNAVPKGSKAPLPQPCRTAFSVPGAASMINDFRSGKIKFEAAPAPKL